MNFITQEEKQSLISHNPDNISIDNSKTLLEKVQTFIFKCCPKISSLQIFNKTGINIGRKVRGKKTLILDIDETLIHSFILEPPDFFDFSFQVSNEGQLIRIYSVKRPGLDEFMKQVKELYEIVFFTASTKEYGDKVIDFISPDTPENHRLFRDSCTFKTGFFIKDLNMINRNLSDMIIVDNNPISFLFNSENGIQATSFFATGEEDTYLMNELLPRLKVLANINDVRDYIVQNQWDLHEF